MGRGPELGRWPSPGGTGVWGSRHTCAVTWWSARWPVSSWLLGRPSHWLWGIFPRWVPGAKAHRCVGSTGGCGPRSLLPSCWSTNHLQQHSNAILKSPAVYTHRATTPGWQISTGALVTSLKIWDTVHPWPLSSGMFIKLTAYLWFFIFFLL